jgi:hypothetical protein
MFDYDKVFWGPSGPAVGPERHGPPGNRGFPHCAARAPSPLHSHVTDEIFHQETYVHLGLAPLQITPGIPAPALPWRGLVCPGPGGLAFAGPTFTRFAW